MQVEKGTFSRLENNRDRGRTRYPTIAISALGSESERSNPALDGVGAYRTMNSLAAVIIMCSDILPKHEVLGDNIEYCGLRYRRLFYNRVPR